MLSPGQILTLEIERPAVGGRMIARAGGQVVLVAGTLPGERVSARIERVSKAVVYAETVAVEDPSPDRRDPDGDPLCGGCLYAHIAYTRQLQIKALVIADAFSRIGRVRLPSPVDVAASPPSGYRMRARLHVQGRRIGFFREGTHDLCDPRPTGQLLEATCDVLDRLQDILAPDVVSQIEVAENTDASERVVHLQANQAGSEGAQSADATRSAEALGLVNGITGITVSAGTGCRVVSGGAHVTDRLALDGGHAVAVRRHVLAFFQGNRFLLKDLVVHVVDCIPESANVLDLYAGGGLFALSAAQTRGAIVTAVEGDRTAADDLVANAATAGGAVKPIHDSVESYTRLGIRRPDIVVVDPPRTGMSKAALDGVVRLAAPRVVYVSCDVATLARDARRLVDAGYGLEQIKAFDLFPNTPHVETVVTLNWPR